jgi:predicted Zn finger-like uncharacterized protein
VVGWPNVSAMLIICSNCSTSYSLDDATVGQAGRTVRCARCHATWFVNPPEPEDPVEAFVDGVLAECLPLKLWP